MWAWPRLKRGILPAGAIDTIDIALDKLQRALTTPEGVVTIPSVANVYTPDMGRAVVRTFQINRTTAPAFTIAKPIGFQSGAILTFDIINTSGGALGVITWAAEYLFLTAFVPPGNGGRATVTFYCASSALVEIASQPDQTAAGGAGEANTGSNQNSGGGVGVFSGKVGVDLQFRGIKSTSAGITVALNAATKEIELTAAVVLETIYTATFDMAGDTMKRLAVVRAGMTAANTVVLLGFRRPGTLEVNDRGYQYSANVIQKYTDGFDVNITAVDWGGDDCTLMGPGESVDLYYLVR